MKTKRRPIAIQINPKKCAHFPACYAATKCQAKAISQAFPRALPQVTMDRCTLCGDCIPACPVRAVSFIYGN